MSTEDLYKSLVRYVLPVEIIDHFEMTGIYEEEGTLHFYLEESNIIPEEYSNKSLTPNGFYEESTIKDFPLRDRKVILHVSRRRWVDPEGKSYSRTWELVAPGTRYSKEFAFFFKEAFGYLPDTIPIA